MISRVDLVSHTQGLDQGKAHPKKYAGESRNEKWLLFMIEKSLGTVHGNANDQMIRKTAHYGQYAWYTHREGIYCSNNLASIQWL